MSVIWGGVCERHHPHRLSQMGGGWIAPWLDRMDRHFDDQGFNDSGLTRARASSSGVIAGSRSRRSKAASRCSPTISGPTRSCGRPTTRLRRLLPECAENDHGSPRRASPGPGTGSWLAVRGLLQVELVSWPAERAVRGAEPAETPAFLSRCEAFLDLRTGETQQLERQR